MASGSPCNYSLRTVIPDHWENWNMSVPKEQAQHLSVGMVLDRDGSKWQITHLDEDYVYVGGKGSVPNGNVIVRADRLEVL